MAISKRTGIIAGSAAALAAVSVATFVLLSGPIRVAPTEDLQAAINSAACGSVIELQAGGVYSVSLVLPRKDCADYITIQSSRVSELPEGVRVSPTQSALLAKLERSPAQVAEPVIKTAAGADHYKFIGVEISTQKETDIVYDLIRLGDGRQTQNTLDSVPHHFTIDRSWIHGFSTQDVQRGISLNSGEATISSCYISDIHGQGYDTQAIAGWNGPGPYHIVNNYLEAAGENIMFGGSDPALEALMPANIEIRRNFVFKPLSWKIGDPSYTGKHWTVKNLLELKNAKNVVIDGNVFENNWLDAQTGVPILFTVRNQDCSAPYSTVQNVTFTNNTVKNASGGGVNFLGVDNESLTLTSNSCMNKANPKPGSIRGDNVLLQNNLFINIGSNFITLNGFNNVRFINNTHPDQKGNLMTLYGDQSQGFQYKNNLTNDHDYGIFGDGGTSGVAALAKYTPNSEVTGNYIGNPYDAAAYPAGNHFSGTIPLPSDYRSPFSGGGADIDALLAAQAGVGVSQPLPSPSPSATATVTVSPSPIASPSVIPSPTSAPTVPPPASPSPTVRPSPAASPSPSPLRICKPDELMTTPPSCHCTTKITGRRCRRF